MDTNAWKELAAQLRVDSIRCSTAAGSGHPTSSMSAADLAAVLFADHLRSDVADPKEPSNDRFVLSKGHAAPLLYAVLKAIGAISDEQLLSLRRMGSPVQGHPAPVPEMPWIDVATGSLGQGLPNALGMALAMRLDGAPGTARRASLPLRPRDLDRVSGPGLAATAGGTLGGRQPERRCDRDTA